jgi:hypothetical protein
MQMQRRKPVQEQAQSRKRHHEPRTLKLTAATLNSVAIFCDRHSSFRHLILRNSDRGTAMGDGLESCHIE